MVQVTLKSSDECIFVVDQAVISASKTINDIIDACGVESVIPLPNVTGHALAKVIEFCKIQIGTGADGANVADPNHERYADFKKNEIGDDVAILFDLVLASNYLNVKSMLDFTTKMTANLIKGKTPEEIRKTFNIKNDFTPEEEEEVRRENQWAFD